MTQNPPPSDLDMRPGKRSPWRNVSIVWLVPVFALVISLGVAWRSYADRGVLIDIEFLNAAGVTSGETTLRYRDVVIGLVEDVRFSDDLENVIVAARVDKEIAKFLDSTAQFWVVRPEVSAEGVSGLSTVLSGVYIEGAWDKNIGGPPLVQFTGLEQRPLIDLNEQGTRVTLRASDGNIMSAGTPVFYRGVRVGRTETPRLDETGSVVLVEAFIEAPHDKLLTTATRFWDTSGFSVSFGTGGLRLDVGSFAALVTGGVAFNTFFSGGDVVEPGQVYDLYEDEADARENAFSRVAANTVRLATIFDGGISGLAPGATLEYEGLPIGEVATISAFVSGEDSELAVRQQVTLLIDPERLGLPADAGLSETLDFLDTAIETGVRARLNTANLLGSSLIVELVKIDGPEPASLDRDGLPYPIIPSVESDLQDVNATVEGVLKRVNALKVEELIEQAISLMASIESLATDQSTRAAPEELIGLLNDTRGLINNEETRALPGELRAAVADLRATIDRINTQGAIERLVSVLENADTATANLSVASAEFPALINDLKEIATKAKDLNTEDLVESATKFMESADAVIGTEAARALPPSLNAALEEIRAIVSELRAGGVAENANVAMASVRSASQSIEEATAGLPALSARLDQLVTRSEELIASYGSRSDFNEETLSMLREVRAAARTITSLTRALERNPNSILFGR